MKTFLVLHLIHLWAQNAALPVLTPNGPLYIVNGGSLNLTCEIGQDASGVSWRRDGQPALIITNTTACSFRTINSPDTYYSVTCDQLRRFTMVKYKLNSSDDNTTWSCQIYDINNNNIGTSSSFKVLLHVPVGSVKLQNGSALSLIENQSAVLVCETDVCRPRAAIYWMKDGLNITDYPNNVTTISVSSDLFVSIGTLTYTGQRVDNRKILTCGAYNGPDSVQASEKLTVTIYYPPSIQGLTSPYKVIESQRLNVTCVVNSNPPADQISWSPSGEGPVPSTLYFSSVSRKQSGTYNCTAQNTMIPTVGTRRNGTNTSQIQVDVLYHPSIQGLTSPYKVIENETLNVTCEANSNPPADQISWFPSGDASVHSTLYFRSTLRNKSGFYSCTAQNTMTPTAGTQQKGMDTSQMQVDVLYPPSIQGLTRKYKVIENQPLNVTCVVSSNPPADQISWSPSGEGPVSSTLYFSSVSRNKSGSYNCTAHNTMIPTVGTRRNGRTTSQIQVDVLYGAGIVNLSVQDGNTVYENSSAIFKCYVDSNPPSNITWMKENSSTVLKTESGVVQSQYIIDSAECLNMGNYTCSGYNGIWTTTKDRLEFFVRCHPRTDFRLTLETKIYRKRTEAAFLRYTVISYPPPRFNWTFLGNGSVSRGLPVSATQHDNGQQSELRLTSLGIDDFGNYMVIADNSLSPSAREVFEIIPADVPEEPSYVMIIEITQTSVTVQWTAGNNGGAMQTFHVVASAGDLIQNVTVADPGYRLNQTAVLEGLQPGTKYSIYLVAINSVGSSNMTEAINVTTLEVITADSSSTFSLPAVAGGIGAGVVVILMAVVALFLWRRYHHRSQHTDGIKQNKNERPRPDSGLVDNPVYDSSGPVSGPSVNGGATGDVYTTVVKPKKKPSSVDKPSTIYAQEDKTTQNFKKEAEKGKQEKTSREAEKGRHEKTSRGDIYENADLVRKRGKPDNLYQNSSNAEAEPSDEIFYEDAGITASNGPLKHKDGLLYADLMLDPPLKKNGEVIIRGLENRTEYAKIAHGKRGEPIPESDDNK